MKKIFTLLTAFAMTATIQAQKVWNMETWGLSEDGVTYVASANYEKDGLKFNGTPNSWDKGGTFEKDGVTITTKKRVKFGGKSTFQKNKTLNRVFEFEATAGETVIVLTQGGGSGVRTTYASVGNTSTSALDVTTSFANFASDNSATGVLEGVVPETGTVYIWADNNVGIHLIAHGMTMQEIYDALNTTENPDVPQKETKVGEVVLAIGEIGDLVEYTDKNGDPATKYVVAAGTNIFEDANITVTNVSATLRANDSKNICGADMTNYIQVRNQNAENTELTITPKANMEFVVYGRLQDQGKDQPIIQNTKNFTLNESGSALNSTMHFSEWLVGDVEKPYEYFLMGQSFTLEAGKTYTLTAGGFGFRLYGFSYTAEAPAEIAAPTHNQEGETVKVNGSQEVVFTPAADHHVVYTCFEVATAPEVETQAAAETVEHEGKTFTLAADNKVTVDKSGTLHYFAMDPETGVKSPVNTIAFDVTTGIADIDVDSDNAPVEYFNMQGIRVANPQNGLYIRRQGNKVEKVYVK